MTDEQPKSPWIVDATAKTFEEDVIRRSHDVPIVIDFWAPWCGPCLALTPVLENLAREFDGKFVLVKANTEELPQVAASFDVRSIPAVYGLRGGEVIDFFSGALPEPQIRSWIERLLPSEADVRVAQAKILEATDAMAAEQEYRAALELDPQLAAAKIGLARLLLAAGQVEESRQLIDALHDRGYLEPEAEKVDAELKLLAQAAEVGSIEECRAIVSAEPENRDARFALAEALAAAGEHEEALSAALELLQQDKANFGERCRELMVGIFTLLPADSPLVGDYRRKLSMALY